jgi:hypothetical protein
VIAIALFTVLAVLGAAALGLCVHLLWLLVTDPLALYRLVAWVVGR